MKGLEGYFYDRRGNEVHGFVIGEYIDHDGDWEGRPSTTIIWVQTAEKCKRIHAYDFTVTGVK